MPARRFGTYQIVQLPQCPSFSERFWISPDVFSSLKFLWKQIPLNQQQSKNKNGSYLKDRYLTGRYIANPLVYTKQNRTLSPVDNFHSFALMNTNSDQPMNTNSYFANAFAAIHSFMLMLARLNSEKTTRTSTCKNMIQMHERIVPQSSHDRSCWKECPKATDQHHYLCSHLPLEMTTHDHQATWLNITCRWYVIIPGALFGEIIWVCNSFSYWAVNEIG